MTRQNGLLTLVSVAILVMVVLTQQARPAIEESSNAFAPSFKVTGEIGKPVELRLGTLTFSDLRLAESLKERDSLGDKVTNIETPGIWVLVDYRFVAARKSEGLEAKLVTNDHTLYRASSRPSSTISTGTISGEPGFPQHGTVAFEIPERALAGSAVTVGADSPYGDALWDTKAVVSLELGPEQASRLISEAPASLTLGGR